jgi:general secretion pathway protein G
MKTPSRRHPAAFTLIELMAVIVIIVILAGLVVGGMGFVSERQAKEKAKIQLKLLEQGLEAYKLDNGTYPNVANSAAGTGRTNQLFRALYWDGAADTTGDKKIYVPELDPTNNKQGWIQGTGATATIVDPWGQEYRYRSGVNASGAANTSTQNPDFDLWSIGKDAKHNTSTINHRDNRDDIRNF